MTSETELIGLAKAKLNIAWSDEGTETRLAYILEESLPAVSDMVGLTYDYDEEESYDEAGEVYDFSLPSMERNLLMNYIAYEWNHQADIFRERYWQEIAACRQRHILKALDQSETESEEEDTEEESAEESEEETTDEDSE